MANILEWSGHRRSLPKYLGFLLRLGRRSPANGSKGEAGFPSGRWKGECARAKGRKAEGHSPVCAFFLLMSALQNQKESNLRQNAPKKATIRQAEDYLPLSTNSSCWHVILRTAKEGEKLLPELVGNCLCKHRDEKPCFYRNIGNNTQGFCSCTETRQAKIPSGTSTFLRWNAPQKHREE